MLFSTLAGFAFAKLRFRGPQGLCSCSSSRRWRCRRSSAWSRCTSSCRSWGGSGTLQAVIVPALVTAFGVFWMTQYLEEALPYELIEAARVDGASMFRTFWSIALPAARPAAAMLALFTFVAQWTNFFWPSIVLNTENPTLPVAVRLLQANYFVDYSLIMAGVFLVTLPLLILFVVRRSPAGRGHHGGSSQGLIADGRAGNVAGPTPGPGRARNLRAPDAGTTALPQAATEGTDQWWSTTHDVAPRGRSPRRADARAGRRTCGRLTIDGVTRDQRRPSGLPRGPLRRGGRRRRPRLHAQPRRTVARDQAHRLDRARRAGARRARACPTRSSPARSTA